MSVSTAEKVEIRKCLVSDVNVASSFDRNTSGLRSSFKWQVYYKQQNKFFERILLDIEKKVNRSTLNLASGSHMVLMLTQKFHGDTIHANVSIRWTFLQSVISRGFDKKLFWLRIQG